MEDYWIVEDMFKAVSAELMELKVMMEDLAGAFYKRYPSTRRTGWTLHLRRCAKNKYCDMCPHSLSWVRYHYVILTKEKKDALKKEKKDAPNSKMSWDNTDEGKYMDCLPKNLNLRREDKKIFRQFEAVRMEIMTQHRALSNLRLKLLARMRTSKTEYMLERDFFEDSVVRGYLTVMLPMKPIKVAVTRKIEDLRKFD